MALEGTVIKSTGSWYKVRLDSGELIDARTRGKLRTQGIKNTNPVAVGDKVTLESDDDTSFAISAVHERFNYIIRKSTKLSKQTHIIAANLDLALVITTLKEPKLKLGFVDRFLITAEAYNIQAHIIFNKADLLNKEEMDYLEQLRAAYKDCGYESSVISVLNNEGIEELKQLIEGKKNLVSGHSGVGKSSLLNSINPGVNVKVSSVSESTDKGQHTTTFAEMFEVAQDTYIIDTPGLKSFGLIDMQPEELKDFLPEIVERSSGCKFHNCLHLNEPSCAVRDAYENGELPWFRYENYLYLIEELKELKQ